MTVIEEIATERQRQIAKGYDAAHDDAHDKHEIANAAAALALNWPGNWPWSLHSWPDSDRRTQLVMSAAMLVAEIERLDRVKLCEVCDHPGATLHVEFDGFACAECQDAWAESAAPSDAVSGKDSQGGAA